MNLVGLQRKDGGVGASGGGAGLSQGDHQWVNGKDQRRPGVGPDCGTVGKGSHVLIFVLKWECF